MTTEVAADADRLRDRPGARDAAGQRRLQVPSAAFTLCAALTVLAMTAWGIYVLDGMRRAAAYAAGVLVVLALAVTVEERRALSRPDLRRWTSALAGSRLFALAAAVVVLLGVAYRLLRWPALLGAGDTPDYEQMAATGPHFDVLSAPWRTPGYSFTLAGIYRLAGAANHVAVHVWQIGLSVLTTLLVMATVYLLLRSRWAALVALGLGALAYPMAVASAFLMTEAQAMFLVALGTFLLVMVHQRRATGAALLALGPTLALAYETRPALMPWAVVVGFLALLAPGARWRQRAVLVLAALLTLAPVAWRNYESPYRVLTAGPAADLLFQNLGEDRFTLYWTAPDSPDELERFHAAAIADGVETEYWLTRPPAELAGFARSRMSLLERSVLRDPVPYAALSLRRLPLTLRYDQGWDMTYDVQDPRLWLVLLDVLLSLAVVAAIAWALRRSWRPMALLVIPTLALLGPLALFHVEPRYSLPALPLVIALAAAGLASLAGLVRAGVAPLRPRALALGGAAVAVLIAAAPAAELWFWPAMVDKYAPRPGLGAGEVASCYVGHQLLTSVAWQPGTSLAVAGGANGMVHWDMRGTSCTWQPITQENVWDLGFSADGTRLAVGSYHAGIVDARTWQPYPPPAGARFLSGLGTEILSVSLDPAGAQLAFAATGFHFVGVYDIGSRKVSGVAQLPASPIAVRWSPDGRTIAVAVADATVRLYDAALRPLGTLALPNAPAALAWSPSSAVLAVGDAAGGILLVDARAAGRPHLAAVSAAHAGMVHSLAYSPDGRSLASAGADHLVRIWDAAGLSPARTLRGDTAPVWSVQWSPDSTRVLTASADGSLGLWTAR